MMTKQDHTYEIVNQPTTNNSGTLITCPRCALHGKKPVLGRLLENNTLLILRFHHGTTKIVADILDLMCGCGYTIHITHGSISNYPAISA